MTLYDTDCCAVNLPLCVCVQVDCVFYPGLPSHPRAALVQELFSSRGAGGMLAFEVVDGPAAEAVLQVGLMWPG